MKFDCDVKMLARALGAVVRVVPQRATLPILGHVLLDVGEEGLALTATNLEVGVRITVPGEVDEVGLTTVPARLLANVVGELHEERVAVSLKENQLRVRAGRSSTTLRTIDADEFPPGPQPADEAPVVLPREELLAAIEQVRPAASTDSARAALTGVLLRLDGSRLVLVATDGHRLVERSLDGVVGATETAVVPAKALAEVGRSFKEETGDVELRFAAARNQVFFRCGSAEVSSRLIDDQYPGYERLIPATAAAVVRAPRAALARAVRMVSVVSELVGSRPVSLLIDAGGIRLLSQAMDVGEAEAEVEADLEGQPMQITFNSRFLLDALSALDVDRVEIRLTGPIEPAVIRGVGTESCTCVVMPIRMAAPPRARSEAA